MSARQGLGRAAVFLAGLHRSDRRWLLAQLPVPRARRLLDLVRQAERHGFDRLDTRDLDGLEGGIKRAPIPEDPTELTDALDGLDPAWAARLLLGGGYLDAVADVSRLDPLRREAIVKEIQKCGGALPVRLEQFMQRALHQRMGGVASNLQGPVE